MMVLLLGAITFAGDLLITEVAPVGSVEFSEDWIEIENIGTTNIVINESYVLKMSNGNTIPLLNSANGTTPISIAADKIVVLHFSDGVNDTDINENNPDFWDLYLGNTTTLSAQYEIIGLNDGTTYIDAIWYKTTDTTYSNTVAENFLVSENQWDTITRPVYYYVGNGLQRISSNDHNNAFDWKNVENKDLNPGKDNSEDLAKEPIELYQNYPNPGNATGTTIKYFLPKDAEEIELKIYTISGDIIKTLINKDTTDYDNLIKAGFQIIKWYGENDAGNEVQTGNYLMALNVDGTIKVKKMTFMR
jgi:hypothetical protein